MARYPKRQKVKRYRRSFYTREMRLKKGIGIAVLVVAVLAAAWVAAPHVLDWATHTWYTVVRDRDLSASSAVSESASSGTQSTAASEPAASSVPEKEPEPEVKGTDIVTGLWAEVDVTTLTDEAAIRSAARQLKAQGMTYAILTLKDTAGQVYYASQTAVGAANAAPTQVELTSVASIFKEEGLVPVAALTAFRDPAGARADHALAIRYQGQEYLWLDNKASAGGNPWLNPYAAETVQYIGDLIAEVHAAGFDQVLLENVQFPSSTSAKQDYGATTVFYPTDGSSPIMVLMGDRTYKTVYLKEGRYDVVLFNRSFDDFGNLGFRGEDAYRTLEAHATNVVTKNVPSTEIIIMDSPDELAADCMESFEVTPGMSGNYSSGMTNWGSKKIDGSKNGCQLCFLPQKLTQKITVKIRIKGMNNIRNATCKLDGIAESVFLASGQISEKTVAQEFCLGNPVYNSGSATDGTLSASISVFGFDAEISHNLHLRAELVDGKTTFEESFDDLKISQLEEGDGRMSIFIDMTCEKKVPNVKVEGSSGFDANVDDWEDEVNSDIDI